MPQLKNGCPRLRDMNEMAIEVIMQTGHSSIQEHDNNKVNMHVNLSFKLHCAMDIATGNMGCNTFGQLILQVI